MTKKSELFKVSEPRWRKTFSRSKWILSSFYEQSHTYSFKYACWGLLWWIGIYGHCQSLSIWALRHITNWLDKYFETKYAAIIAQYSSDTMTGENVSVSEYPIWTFWWQGRDSMPPIVQKCFNRIKNNNKNVILLTQDNYHQYANIPQGIYEKVIRGDLSFTHFSDILRLTLLAERGGMWIDVTCFNPYPIPDNCKLMPFCSPHDIKKQNRLKDNYSYWCDCGGWRSWNIGTCVKNHPLFLFCRDLIQEIALQELCIPNYFLVDCVIGYAYRKLPNIKEMIDNMPDVNVKCADLFLNYFNKNKIYSEQEYQNLIQDNWLFKLTYKTIWQKEVNGEKTFYGKLFEDE